MVIPLAPLPMVWLVETIACSWTEVIPAGRLLRVWLVSALASRDVNLVSGVVNLAQGDVVP